MQRPLASMILILVILVLSVDHAYAWPKGSGIPLAQQPLGNKIDQIDVSVGRGGTAPWIQFNALIGVTSCGIDADGDERDCEVEELLCSNWCSDDCGGGCESDYFRSQGWGQCATHTVELERAIAHCIESAPKTGDGTTCDQRYLDCDDGSYAIGDTYCHEDGERREVVCDYSTWCVDLMPTGDTCDPTPPSSGGSGGGTVDECTFDSECRNLYGDTYECDGGTCVVRVLDACESQGGTWEYGPCQITSGCSLAGFRQYRETKTCSADDSLTSLEPCWGSPTYCCRSPPDCGGEEPAITGPNECTCPTPDTCTVLRCTDIGLEDYNICESRTVAMPVSNTCPSNECTGTLCPKT
jgi:hypothetical protein